MGKTVQEPFWEHRSLGTVAQNMYEGTVVNDEPAEYVGRNPKSQASGFSTLAPTVLSSGSSAKLTLSND